MRFTAIVGCTWGAGAVVELSIYRQFLTVESLYPTVSGAYYTVVTREIAACRKQEKLEPRTPCISCVYVEMISLLRTLHGGWANNSRSEQKCQETVSQGKTYSGQG